MKSIKTDVFIDSNGRYKNPWKTWNDASTSFTNVFNMIKYRTQENYNPNINDPEVKRLLQVYKPLFIELPSHLQATWLGHASVLFNINKFKILTDPVFSNRCSAVQIAGPKRYTPAPCKISELPSLDFVIISHNHYDHLDSNSIRAISNSNNDEIVWLVPDGDGDLIKSLLSNKNSTIVEMKWWNEYHHQKDDREIKITFVPVQHWSGRNVIFDRNKSLWGGYVVESDGKKVFFAGDTGYCDGFKEIGDFFNGIHLSALPIGAYYPRDFFKCQHVDPEEAVKIHEDVKSKYSFGIHWGTFPLTFEGFDRPREDLKKALAEKSIEEKYFRTLNPGQCICIPYDETEESFIQE